MLWPMVRGTQYAVVTDHEVRIRLGILGSATIACRDIIRLSTVDWPWWAGFGVRFGRKMVAFTTSHGRLALIELREPIMVRTPLPWRTPRIAISVEDVDGFLRAVAHSNGQGIQVIDTPG